MSLDVDKDIQLRITFTQKDIQAIEAIVQNFGYRLDQTGILSHILNEYRMFVGDEDVE